MRVYIFAAALVLSLTGAERVQAQGASPGPLEYLPFNDGFIVIGAFNDVRIHEILAS